ncbi:neprilysin-1-like [Ixodes scapularis]|uniref:neprilysin-1-like n=1 Tax=Ixodes scapularis TaxID=6945 RepID=UPI001A9CF088|nr:neprilysin-1-like [Ixodes scapularis]
MRRREMWSSKHQFMIPHAQQLIAIWALYMIVELAGLSEAKPSGGVNGKNVCRTDACQQRAKYILDGMNQTEDPCTDFYAYVCGNWKKSHQIPDHKNMIGHHDILADKAEEDVTPVDEGNKFEDLLKLLKEKGFTKWPILKGEDPPYSTYNELLNKTGFSPLIHFQVYQDAKRNEKYVIYLDRITFSWLDRSQLIHQTKETNKKIVQAYKELISTSVKLFRSDTNDKGTEAQDVSEEILQFEAKLAKISLPTVNRRNASLLYNEANISILTEEFPKIKWMQILNSVFSHANITLDTSERVILIQPQYIYDLENILENTSLSTLYNYVYWTQIRTHGSVASKTFEQLAFDFKKGASGVKTDVPLWKKCTSAISGVLKHALGRLYVDYFFKPKAKRSMDHLVDVLNSTFGEMLENNTWMDKDTREEALKKIQKMIYKIGYPDWIHNDTYLNELYEHVPDISLNDSFLNVLHSLEQNNFIKNLKNLRQPYNKEDEWDAGVAIANAFYNSMTNAITFPAGILHPPFYQDDVPSSINMAAIGSVIGHEITHAFDDNGNQYDADGKLRNWWTDAAKQAFLKRADCFVQLYNVTVKEVNMTVNGYYTLNENMADNSGLTAAYLAWKKFNDTEQLLPGLEHLTGDKLFFVSNANVWCQNIREERLRHDLYNDNHSPTKYRVNLPMGNSQAFLDAFSCGPCSPMNVKNKCVVW